MAAARELPEGPGPRPAGLTLFQATGHQHGQALALNAVGWCHALRGDYQQTRTACQQALTLLQQLGNRAGQAHTWDSLGYAHHHLGHHTPALTCYHQALALSRDLDDRYLEATTLTHLGDTHHGTGNLQAARDAWQQALTILDDLDHPGAAQVRTKLAGLDPPTDPEPVKSLEPSPPVSSGRRAGVKMAVRSPADVDRSWSI